MKSTETLHPGDRDAVSTLIHFLDSRADQTKDRRSNTRASERRKFRAECKICFVARDGGTLINDAGLTRDVSESGIGFVLRRRLAPNTPLRVTVVLPEGRECHLTGVVAHNRPEKGGWYLIGMQFQGVSDERLKAPLKADNDASEDESSEPASPRRAVESGGSTQPRAAPPAG